MRSKNLSRFLIFFVLFFLYSAVQATPTNLDVTATPNNTPTVVQPTGGNVDYRVTVKNNDGAAQSFDFWVSATLPDGTVIQTVSGPELFNLPAGWDASGTLTQSVEGFMPSGIYTLTTSVGTFPDLVISASNFYIEKLAVSLGGWFTQDSGTTDYPTDIYFADALNGWVVGSRNMILHTTDGGDNWYRQSSPPSTNYSAVHFIDAATGWAVGSSGKIAHTTDGGTTWTAQSAGTRSSIYGVFFLDANNGWIVGGKEGSYSPARRFIYKTTDGGDTWQSVLYQSYYNPLTKVVFTDAQNGWAIGSGGAILRTSNGGQTWSTQTSGTTQNLQGISFVDASNGWIAGYGGVMLHTRNGGQTWVQQNTGTTLSLGDVAFIDAYQGWAVGGALGNGLILHTIDGGNSWQEQAAGTPNPLNAVFFTDPANGWATGYSGTIVHTANGGN